MDLFLEIENFNAVIHYENNNVNEKFDKSVGTTDNVLNIVQSKAQSKYNSTKNFIIESKQLIHWNILWKYNFNCMCWSL